MFEFYYFTAKNAQAFKKYFRTMVSCLVFKWHAEGLNSQNLIVKKQCCCTSFCKELNCSQNIYLISV